MTKQVIRGLVEKLGGQKEVADALSRATDGSVGASSVAMWAVRGRVPWRWRLPLAQLAQLKGAELSVAEAKALELTGIKAEKISDAA